MEAPWWGPALGTKGLDWWLEAVDAAALAVQPLRRRQGLLHAASDLLKHLGHRMQVRFSCREVGMPTTANVLPAKHHEKPCCNASAP